MYMCNITVLFTRSFNSALIYATSMCGLFLALKIALTKS